MALEDVLMSFNSYIPLISIIIGMISEETILLLAVLSGNGNFPLWKVWIFGFIGILIHDSIYYYISKSRFAHFLKAKLKLKKIKISKLVENRHKKNYSFILFLSKFIYPTRVSALIYFGHKENKFIRYTIYNSAAVALWSLFMMPIAWLAGNGLSYLFNIVNGIEKILSIAAIAALIYYIVKKIDLSFLKRFS